MRKAIFRAALLAIIINLIYCLLNPVREDFRPAHGQRGESALFTSAYIERLWPASAYTTAWKNWPGVVSQPEDYDSQFRAHYGLGTAPYSNGRYPLGLRENPKADSRKLVIDCMLCHAGTLFGNSVIGLGNSTLDLAPLLRDLSSVNSDNYHTEIISNVRGTTEAWNIATTLLAFRMPDLGFRPFPAQFYLRGFLCGDTPAWWLLKKKKTLFYTGNIDSRSVRALMLFMLAPTNSRDYIINSEDDFRDIQKYILDSTSPRYPFEINLYVARAGRYYLKNTAQSAMDATGTIGFTRGQSFQLTT